MKLIIRDHLKRWGLIWITIGIANYFMTVTGSFFDHGSGINPLTFQLFLWLGAFELNYDLMRGHSRVLTTLPVTSRQIGRAWWLFSVLLPALFLTITSGLALLFHFHGSVQQFPTNGFVMTAITNLLFFGALFYLFIGSRPGRPQDFARWVRMIFAASFIIGMLFIRPTVETTQGIILLLVAAILTIAGWFGAEQMALMRGSFKVVPQFHGKKTPSQKISQGFGGLPYFVQKTFFQTALIGLAIVIWLALVMFFLPSSGLNRPQMLSAMIDGGSTPYIFVLLFSVIPMIYQLRFLRTLPVSSSALAATLVFLPVASLAAIGLIVTGLATCMAGEAMIPHTINIFLMLGAKAAVMVSVIVWRGLDAVTYAFLFLMVIAESFINLGLTVFFHLGSKISEQPLWVSLVIFLMFAALSFTLTRTLITKNSNAYRVRAMPMNTWGMLMRR